MERWILVFICTFLTLLPLFAAACPSGEKYCPDRDGCISASQNCSDGEILTCVNMTSPCDKNGTIYCVDAWNYTCGDVSCGNNTKYCRSKNECIDSDEYCCSLIEEACVEVSEYMHFLRSKRMKSICQLIASDEGNFTANYTGELKYYNPIEKEMCDNGTYFCPLVHYCISMNESCDPSTVYRNDDDSFAVFEKKCAKNNKTFCSLYMHCIPMHEHCSYRKLFDWYKAGNKSIDLYSQPCPANQTFCPLTFGCRDNCDPNDVMGNKSCNGTNGNVCRKRMDCGANGASCGNFTNVIDPTGSGWLETCKYRGLIKSVFWKKASECKPHAAKCTKKDCDFDICEKLSHMNKTEWLWSEINRNGSAGLRLGRCNFTMNASMMYECDMKMKNKSCDDAKDLCDIVEEKMWIEDRAMNESIWIKECNMTVNASSMMHECKFCDLRKLCKPLKENNYNRSKVNKTVRVRGCDVVFNETVIKTCGISFGPFCKIEDLCPKYRQLAINYTKKSFPKMLGDCKVDWDELEQCNITLWKKNDSCEVHKLCHLLGDVLKKYKNDSSMNMNETVSVGNCNITMSREVLDVCGNRSCEIEDLCHDIRKILDMKKHNGWSMLNKTVEMERCNITVNKTVMELCNIKREESCEVKKLCKVIRENDYNISMVNKTIRIDECDIVFNKSVLDVCNIKFEPSCKVEDLCPRYRALAFNHTTYSFPKYIEKCKVDFEDFEQCNVTLIELKDYYYEMFYNGFKISQSVKKKLSYIAVRGVGEADDDHGVWEYKNNGAWMPLGPVSSDRAVVLGSDIRLRFVANDSSWHGLLTLMYSPQERGATGSHVNVSDILHDPRNTLALLQYPSRPVVNVTGFIGGVYTVGEDEKTAGFKIEDKIAMNLSHTVMEKDGNMSEYFEHLHPRVVKDYEETVKCFEDFVPAIAMIEIGKPSEGSWEVNDRKVLKASVAKPQVVSPHDLLRFVSAKHVYGNWSMKFVPVAYSNCSGPAKEEYFDAPAPLAHAFKGVMMMQNTSKEIRKLVEFALGNMTLRGTSYSLENFNGVVDGLSGSREAKNAAKDVASLAFEAVSLPNEKRPSGLPRVLRPKGNLVILNNPTVFTFNVHVTPKNDQPGIKTSRIFFPSIAYNLTSHPNKGQNVEYLLTKAQAFDVDRDKLGIAVIEALNSSIGSWYYKSPSGTWTQVIVDNPEYTKSRMISAFIFNSSYILKFKMHSDDTLWSNLDASRDAKIVFLPWDGSDGYTIGWRNVTRPSNDTSAYGKTSVTAIVQRIGCDGREGSKGREDRCGVCGGDGLSCMGCDGILNSGAIIDECGNCTGGNTSLKYNAMKDCAQECGLSFLDNCSICQRKKRFVNFTDCTGTCFGKAKINKCGYCAGGTSGKQVTYGEDACGICSGNGSTCLDCAGDPNGGKIRDFCNKCLSPSDSSFNSECVKLKRTVPDSGLSRGDIEVIVQGAGLKTYATVSCEMIKNDTNRKTSIQSSSFAEWKNGRVVKFTTPPLEPGYYNVLCKFDSESRLRRVEESLFLVYNKSAITYTSVTPKYTYINKAETAVIAGNGFVNAPDIACISRDGRVFDAEFVNSTRVSCSIPATKVSARLELGVSFSRGDRQLGHKNITFFIYANASNPTSARFLNNLRGILIMFDVPTKPRTRSTDCATFFPSSNVSLFGSRSKCIFITPLKMVIVLRRGPRIVPNDTIKFQLASITQRRQSVTKDPVEMYKDLVVASPILRIVPTAVITGTRFLGVCAILRLYAGQSRGGGDRRLVFIWGVEWANPGDSAIDANATADLNETKQYLSTLLDFQPKIIGKNRQMIVIGPRYKFTLRVKNFLGELSDEASLVVQRQDKSLPELSLGTKKKTIKTALGTTLQGKVGLSSCLPAGYEPKILFSWEIQAVGVVLGIVNKPRLTIPSGLLKGGKTYILTLTAAMQSDLSLTTTATIELVVESSDLNAIIKGGGSIVVGEDGSFVLDGSRSSDPDGSSDAPSYDWSCFDNDKNPCFEPDPRKAGGVKRMVIPSGVKATINVAEKLKTNSTYNFVLAFRKGNRRKETSVSVIVKPGAPPFVLIRPLSAVKINPTDVLNLESFISSKKTFNATWSCVQSDEYGFIDLEAEGVALTPLFQKFAKGSASLSLVIAKNKLENGVTYKFQLTVEHSDSSSFADIQITTNAAPSQGTLEVSPSSGFFGNTTFTFSASEGWDDDADDLPMTYQFGYYIRDSDSGELREELLWTPSEFNSLEIDLLPQGEAANNYSLKVFVKVSDIYGAVTMQEASVTVKPIPIDVSAVNELAGAVDSDFESGDLAKAAAKANAIAAAVASSGVNDPDTIRAARDFKNAVTDKVLSSVEDGGIQDKSGRDVVKGSLLQMTSGCKPSCALVRIARNLLSMEGGRQSPSKRRRRAVGVSGDSIEIKTGVEVMTILNIFQNVLDPEDYSNNSLVAKSDFLSTVKAQEPSLCKGLATGGPYEIAKSNITVMRAVKDAFASVDAEFMEVSTSTSPEYIEATVMYRLGEALKTQYDSWACTADDTCTGTCIATAQFKHDFLIQHDPVEKNITRLSDVASLRLYNPQTLAELSVSGLASPIALRFPIDNGDMYENYTKECRMWHEGSKEWQMSGCTGYTAINNSVIECSCTQLGYVAVFLGPQGLPTTPKPTQKPTNAKTTVEPEEARVVEFAFYANYSQIISGNRTKAVFISHLLSLLAKLLNISPVRITNIDIRSGSIIVTLTILPSNGTNEASVNATVLYLEKLVKTNNINLTLPGTNQTLTVDPSSFKILAQPTTRSPPSDDDDDDDGLSTAEIVIIVVVCVIVVIALIVALLYYLLRVKPTRAGKISPHGSHMQLKEQQNNNEAGKDSGVTNKAVAADVENEERSV